MNELTFLASLMPSELTGLFNKLALEYCSPPSPFAIAELADFLIEKNNQTDQIWGNTSSDIVAV